MKKKWHIRRNRN